jgi:hypothetical protein
MAWGRELGQAILDWRENDGFGTTNPPFCGGLAVGQ